VYGEHAEKFFKKNMSEEIVLFTDKNKAYDRFENIVETHFTVVSGKESTNDTLKWVHKIISNLKRKLLAINHMITYKYLQNYLNDFVYKLNRRYFADRLFDRLIIAGIYPYVQ
jgi:20S proteasome alpha/beta subunit